MNAQARQREARRAALQAQCAGQRERLSASFEAVQHHLQPIDRGLSTLQALRRKPLLFGGFAALAAVTAVLFAGRARRLTLGRFSWLLPLAAPVLKMLEMWWRQRRSAAPPSVSETPPPDRR